MSVFTGSVGVVLELIVEENGAAVDISAASNLKMVLVKPDGTRIEKTAVLSGTGTDGKMRYTTIAGDLDQAGEWLYQGSLTVGTWSGVTDVLRMDVLSVL